MQAAMRYINRLSISEYFGHPKLTETTGIKVFIVTRRGHRSRFLDLLIRAPKHVGATV